jgi:hypothetical protein
MHHQEFDCYHSVELSFHVSHEHNYYYTHQNLCVHLQIVNISTILTILDDIVDGRYDQLLIHETPPLHVH